MTSAFTKFLPQCLILALALALLGLGACGQSGPLYLPGNPSDVQESTPVPVEQRAEQDEEDDEEDAGRY